MKNHKINKKGLLISFIITLILWYAPNLNSEAGKYTKIINSLYEQLVVGGRNEASFTTSEEVSLHELEVELCKADNDSFFDGAALINRGQWSLTKKGSSYTVTIKNAYNIKEADALADKLAEEVREKAGADAPQNVLFYEMTNYIKDTFSYDHLEHTHQNFVESYNGDRKLVCTGYAQVTDLLANKLGLEADTVFGKDHVYNIIKVDNEYIAYDASCGLYIYGLVPGILGRMSTSTNANLILDVEEKAYNLGLNESKPFRYANMNDITGAMAYNLLKYHRVYEIMIIVATLAVTALIFRTLIKALKPKKKNIKKFSRKGRRYAR